MRYSVKQLLDVMTQPDDILIIQDIDEMTTKDAILKYDPQKNLYACTELRIVYYYFNRGSVYDSNETTAIPNYWYAGTKFITFEKLKATFAGDVVELRKSTGCKTDLASRFIGSDPLTYCDQFVIEQAGWHFSYVLDDLHLQRKVRSRTDQLSISDYQYFKSDGQAIHGYLRNYGLYQLSLPKELLR